MPLKTYLLERSVIRAVYDPPDNAPIMKLFDLEGPIIRLRGEMHETNHGDVVILESRIGQIGVSAELVQEVLD